MYDHQQRAVALGYGIVCHTAFGLGVAAMIRGLYDGLASGRGPFSGTAAVAADALLAAQFVALHSFLLSPRGRRVLERLTPLGLGRDLATTMFAAVASLQLGLVFQGWSPVGPVWASAHGALRAALGTAYAASWLFVARAMFDAGLGVQSGFRGWGAVVRDRAPRFGDFPTGGCFRWVRQPIYLAFALTLWTGPTWTPDHLFLAIGWTLYCVGGPLLKERRYLRAYGQRFARYRALVPYWLPRARALDPARLGERA